MMSKLLPTEMESLLVTQTGMGKGQRIYYLDTSLIILVMSCRKMCFHRVTNSDNMDSGSHTGNWAGETLE
jgi:putative component of toxin-antitoxin plasmid stabilization module